MECGSFALHPAQASIPTETAEGKAEASSANESDLSKRQYATYCLLNVWQKLWPGLPYDASLLKSWHQWFPSGLCEGCASYGSFFSYSLPIHIISFHQKKTDLMDLVTEKSFKSLRAIMDSLKGSSTSKAELVAGLQAVLSVGEYVAASATSLRNVLVAKLQELLRLPPEHRSATNSDRLNPLLTSIRNCEDHAVKVVIRQLNTVCGLLWILRFSACTSRQERCAACRGEHPFHFAIEDMLLLADELPSEEGTADGPLPAVVKLQLLLLQQRRIPSACVVDHGE